MDIRELRSFLVLAEQLHFGTASQLLHLSQPALTKQIRRLEEELGSPLFQRGKHGTRLSAFGEQFLPGVRSLVQAFDQLLDRSLQAAEGNLGRLNLGFGFHTFELVPRLIVRLRSERPGIEVSLKDMSTSEQVAELEEGTIDLGFIRMPAPPQFQSLAVIQDRLALVSSSASPLPAHATLADCRKIPFVALSEGRSPGFYQHVLRLCAKHGFHPRVVQEVPEFTTALALVRAGLGVAVMPQSFWTSRFAGIRLHPIKDPEAEWAVGAVWRNGDTNPALKIFLDLLRAELALDTHRE